MTAQATTPLRAITYNLAGRRDVTAQLTLCDQRGWDVLLVQEATAATIPKLAAHPSVRQADTAFAHFPERQADPRVRYSSAILLGEGLAFEQSAPLQDVPSPERTLWATVVIEATGQRLDVASLAAPPSSSGWGKSKVDQIQAYAGRFASRDRPLLVGVDANAPKHDHLDERYSEWWWPEEADVWGHRRQHDLRDVYRTHIERHPHLQAAIARERPDGPLAITHLRGRTNVPSRYDFLFASPELEIAEADVVWEPAGTTLSDHGLVWAELRLPRWRDRDNTGHASRSTTARGDLAIALASRAQGERRRWQRTTCGWSGPGKVACMSVPSRRKGAVAWASTGSISGPWHLASLART